MKKKLKPKLPLKPLAVRMVEARAYLHNAYHGMYPESAATLPKDVRHRYYAQLAILLCYEMDRQP